MRLSSPRALQRVERLSEPPSHGKDMGRAAGATETTPGKSDGGNEGRTPRARMRIATVSFRERGHLLRTSRHAGAGGAFGRAGGSAILFASLEDGVH